MCFVLLLLFGFKIQLTDNRTLSENPRMNETDDDVRMKHLKKKKCCNEWDLSCMMVETSSDDDNGKMIIIQQSVVSNSVLSNYHFDGLAQLQLDIMKWKMFLLVERTSKFIRKNEFIKKIFRNFKARWKNLKKVRKNSMLSTIIIYDGTTADLTGSCFLVKKSPIFSAFAVSGFSQVI